MSSRMVISREDPGRIRVLGLLSIETVADYQEEGFEVLAEVGNVAIFDLCEADVVGSAVIALLISWQRRAIQLKKTFSVENAPMHLIEMADVSGVREIIAFKG